MGDTFRTSKIRKGLRFSIDPFKPTAKEKAKESKGKVEKNLISTAETCNRVENQLRRRCGEEGQGKSKKEFPQ